MLKLDLSPEPRWVELLPGVRVLARQMDNVVWIAARADSAVIEAALAEDRATFTVTLACAVAQRLVTEWEGVGDLQGVPIRTTPEAVATLIRSNKRAYEAFDRKVLGPWFEVQAEGNALPPAPSGPLGAGGTEAALSTATDATPDPVRTAQAG